MNDHRAITDTSEWSQLFWGHWYLDIEHALMLGTDPNQRFGFSGDGSTALHHLADTIYRSPDHLERDARLAELLLRHGANCQIRAGICVKWTPLQWAKQNRDFPNVPLIRILHAYETLGKSV